VALTRGSGLSLPASNASNGYWGANNWSTTTAAAGVSANKFLKFSLKSTNGKSVNYQSIDKFNIRINSSGPIQYQIDYQVDNGAFYPCATITGPTRTTGNYILGPIDLSSIDGLQDVPSTTTITFRITPFDATDNTGSFLIGSGTTDTEPDLVLTGGFSDANIITTSLPVTLTNFQLNRNTNKVLLSWETQTEVNFSHFELERSEDLNTFYAIATINGANQFNGNKYSYTDASNATVTKYYRLKMIDKDGSFTYSKVLSDIYNTTNTPFVVYPTVSNGNSLKATFKSVAKSAQLKVLNSFGQPMNIYNLPEGTTVQKIETINLSKGAYFLILCDNGTIQSNQFIKQ
jgi:hypothetical protein